MVGKKKGLSVKRHAKKLLRKRRKKGGSGISGTQVQANGNGRGVRFNQPGTANRFGQTEAA